MSTSHTPPIIRHARREDVPNILTLIHALGSHNKDLSSVHSSEATLLQHLSFAISPTITTISPEHDNTNRHTNLEEDNSATEVLESLSSTKTARALLLFDSAAENPAGMAIYYHTFSTWTGKPGIYLEDLFVRSEFRGKGYGKALLRRLARLVQEQGGARLQWTCLKWNQASLDFYTSETVGAEIGERHCYLRVEGEKLEKLAAGGSGP